MREPDAAVAIVRTRSEDPSVLLIRRTERPEDPSSGHWSFPGGRRDPSDVALLDTALRELEEECGIRLRRESMRTALLHTFARRRSGPFLLVAPFVFEVDQELPAVPCPRETAETLWVPLRTLLDPARHYLRCVPGMPVEMRFPALDLNNDVPLWGFTYRLIADWLGLGKRSTGFETAQALLEYVLSEGLVLERGWQDGTATVRGLIPVASVMSHCSVAGRYAPDVNCVEVRPEYIRVVDAEFDEYIIRAVPERDGG